MASRSLDFIVIGVQKGGTTSLWHYLRRHPAISTPERKEEPFFCQAESDRPDALDEYMNTHFADAPEGALLGKASPQYMMGNEQFDVERIAGQIATALPDVRLIALLRDPIERAFSQYRMSARRGWEQRTFEQAVNDQLNPEQARTARRHPMETNSYVTQGEYGRSLGAYRKRFPAEQIQVELTADLDHDTGAVLDRILAFLSLPAGYRPPRLEARHHRGGTGKLLDAESEAELFEFMQEMVWPNLGEESERVRRLFMAFLMIWNVAPQSDPPQLSAPTRARLEEHYEADVEALDGLGIPAPWIEAWRVGAIP